MSEPFLGEIRMAGFNFAPPGWAFCDGALLALQQNTALFYLLSTRFGGDGVTTFALPDLRGRVPVHQGQGPGLSTRAGTGTGPRGSSPRTRRGGRTSRRPTRTPGSAPRTTPRTT